MQAGCELSWNLSGPYFAKESESTFYSSINLAFVGLRGCLCPFIGQLIFIYSNSMTLFICAGLLCLMSGLYALWLNYEHKFKILYNY